MLTGIKTLIVIEKTQAVVREAAKAVETAVSKGVKKLNHASLKFMQGLCEKQATARKMRMDLIALETTKLDSEASVLIQAGSIYADKLRKE